MICSLEDDEIQEESEENENAPAWCPHRQHHLPPPAEQHFTHLGPAETPCFAVPAQRAVSGHLLDTSDTDESAEQAFSELSVGPILPRCLAFDAETGDSATSGEHAQNVAKSQSVPLPPESKAVALSRLKQRTDERHSNHLAALARLKQLAAMKQWAKLAAMRPATESAPEVATAELKQLKLKIKTRCEDEDPTQAVLPSTAPGSNNDLTLTTPYPQALICLPKGTFSAAVLAESPTEAASESSSCISKKPYLRRKSQPMTTTQQLPDWSAVQSKTHTKLDTNLILRPRSGRRPSSAAGSRRAITLQQQQQGGGGGVTSFSSASSQHRRENKGALAANPTIRKPWGGTHGRSSPPFHPRRRSFTRPSSGGPLAQGRPPSFSLTPAQKAARATPFVPSPPTSEAYGPLGLGMGARKVHPESQSLRERYATNPAVCNNVGVLGGRKLSSSVNRSRQSEHEHQQHRSRRLSTGSCLSGSIGSGHDELIAGGVGDLENPLGGLVSQVDELLSSVERAISLG